MKQEPKEKAIALRQHGFSYSEILKEVVVAKSTLSLWLRTVGLSKQQKQRLTEKKLAAALRGAKAKKDKRILTTKTIKDAAKSEVVSLIKDPFWLLGTILYWAEGSKEKVWRTGSKLAFTNMDIDMHKLFIRWLKKHMGIDNSKIRYELYIHENSEISKIERAKKFWAHNLGCSANDIRLYLKKDKKRKFRKNDRIDYNGVLRVSVIRGTNLNRKIAGWIEGVIKYFSK